MKKKVVAALMSVAMVATLFAGCGSKAEDTTTATDTTATTEDTADKADEAAADTKEGDTSLVIPTGQHLISSQRLATP